MTRLPVGLLLAAFLAGPADAQQSVPVTIDIERFCGINDSVSPTKLEACDAQDAENVLTDDGSLEQIPGMTELIAEAVPGFPIRNMWEFRAPSGTKYLLFHSSGSIWQTDFSGSPSILRDVDPDFDVDAVQAFDKIFFVNGSEDLWYWDEVSTFSVTGIICSFIDFADERLYCANTDANSSQLRTSDFGNFSTWTITGEIANDPSVANSFTFQEDDGDQISCLKVTPCGKFVGKPHSTHILKGFDNDTYYKRIIDPDIGCVDDRLVQMLDGSLIWLSLEGVYAWDCRGAPKLISQDIDNRVKAIRQLAAFKNELIVNLQVEWEAGLISKNGPSDSWSTTISPGEIVPSTWTDMDTSSTDFSGGTLSQTDLADVPGSVVLDNIIDFVTWSTGPGTSTGTILPASDDCNIGAPWGADGALRLTGSTVFGGVASSTDTITIQVLDASDDSVLYSSTSFHEVNVCRFGEFDTSTQTASQFKIKAIDQSARVIISTGFDKIDKVPFYSITKCGFGFCEPNCPCSRSAGLPDPFYIRTGTFTSRIFDTGFLSPIHGPFEASVSSPTGTGIVFDVQVSTANDGGGFDAPVGVSIGSQVGAANKRYMSYIARFTTSLATSTPSFLDATLAAASTGTYSSAVQFLGSDITSFGTGDFITTEIPDGLLSFQVRSGTYAFPADTTSIAWTDHVDNTQIPVSTGTHFQFRILSGETASSPGLTSSTQTAIVSRAVTNWNEGEANRGASLVHDHRYLMSVTTDLSSTANDSVEILQENNEWTRLKGKSLGAMTIYDNKPVAGSGQSDSGVWNIMVDGINTFAGDTINAFWTTGDFTAGRPHSDKVLREMWIDADPEAGASVDIGFAVNRSTTRVIETVDLAGTNGEAYVNERVHFDEEFARGRYHNFIIRNIDLDEFFKVNRLTIFADVEPRFE